MHTYNVVILRMYGLNAEAAAVRLPRLSTGAFQRRCD